MAQETLTNIDRKKETSYLDQELANQRSEEADKYAERATENRDRYKYDNELSFSQNALKNISKPIDPEEEIKASKRKQRLQLLADSFRLLGDASTASGSTQGRVFARNDSPVYGQETARQDNLNTGYKSGMAAYENMMANARMKDASEKQSAYDKNYDDYLKWKQENESYHRTEELAKEQARQKKLYSDEEKKRWREKMDLDWYNAHKDDEKNYPTVKINLSSSTYSEIPKELSQSVIDNAYNHIISNSQLNDEVKAIRKKYTVYTKDADGMNSTPTINDLAAYKNEVVNTLSRYDKNAYDFVSKNSVGGNYTDWEQHSKTEQVYPNSRAKKPMGQKTISDFLSPKPVLKNKKNPYSF